MDLKDRKRINNLPKYDIGKMPTMSGYLLGLQADLSSFSSTPGYDYNKDARELNKTTTANLVTLIPNVANNIYNLAKPAFSAIKSASTAASTAANTTSTSVSSGIESADAFGQLFNPATTGLNGTPMAAEAIQGTSQGASTGASAGTGAASTASAATSYVTGGIAAALGAYGMGTDIAGYYNNRINSSDVVNATGKQTASKYGLTYDIYGGTNTQSILNYVDALNRASRTNLTLNSTGFGAGVGSIIGTAISPGYGTLIGTGIGAISGALSGFFGGGLFGKSRKEAAQESINNAMIGMLNANLQNEAEAGSLGLRNQFNATHADKGKNITFDKGKVGDIRMVHTSHGIVPGVQFGLAGKGETIYDPQDGTASVYDEGLKRVDNIPTGIPLPGFNKGKWNNTIIFGNKTNPLTGNTFAEDAKPYSRILEQYNKGKNKMTLSKHTELVNRKNALSALDSLANVQMYAANCGKNRFDSGWNGYVVPGVTHGLEYLNVMNDRPTNAYVPENNFVSNSQARAALNALNLSYDPTLLVGNLVKTGRQNQYKIMQSPGTTAGEKMIANTSNNLAIANAINNVYNDALKENNAYRTAYGNALMAYGLNEATRKQQERMYESERKDNAYSKYNDALNRNMISRNNVLSSLAKDYYNIDMFNQSKNYQQALIDLYGNQQKIDMTKLYNDYMNNNPAAKSKVPSVKTGWYYQNGVPVGGYSDIA